jgi:hypothetical protein
MAGKSSDGLMLSGLAGVYGEKNTKKHGVTRRKDGLVTENSLFLCVYPGAV